MQTEAKFVARIKTELGYLKRIARSLARADSDLADDLLQQTLFNAWRYKDSYTPESNFRAWLTVIMRNNHYTAVRRRKFEVSDPDQVHARRQAVADRAPAMVDLNRLARRVNAGLDEMPHRMRSALVGHCVNHMQYEELAKKLRCPLGTVRSSINRGRARLRAMVGPELLEVLAEPIDQDVLTLDSDSDSATGSDSTLSLS